MNDACEVILNRVFFALQDRLQMVRNNEAAAGQDDAMDHLQDVSRLRAAYYEWLIKSLRNAFEFGVPERLRDKAPFFKGRTERATHEARSSLELGLDIVDQGLQEMRALPNNAQSVLGMPLDTFKIEPLVAEAWSNLGMGEVHEVVLVETFLPMLLVLRELPDIRSVFPYGKAPMLKVVENRCQRWAEARAKTIRDAWMKVEKPATFDDYADVP